MPRGAGDTRQRILDAALPLFCQNGYDATPVSDIAAAVDIRPAAFYYHFDSKDSLLRALVEPLADAIDQLIAAAPGADSTAESRRILHDGWDRPESHEAQPRMIRRYIARRNRNVQDVALRES